MKLERSVNKNISELVISEYHEMMSTSVYTIIC